MDCGGEDGDEGFDELVLGDGAVGFGEPLEEYIDDGVDADVEGGGAADEAVAVVVAQEVVADDVADARFEDGEDAAVVYEWDDGEDVADERACGFEFVDQGVQDAAQARRRMRPSDSRMPRSRTAARIISLLAKYW